MVFHFCSRWLAAGLLAAAFFARTAASAQPAQADVTPLDPATSITLQGSDLGWFDAAALTIEGKGWAVTEATYERLPARAKGKVPEMVWDLSKNTAGIAVRFVTNSRKIWADWDGGDGMPHMPATGVSGLDLYVRRGAKTAAGGEDAGAWEYCGTGRPAPTRTTGPLNNYGDLPGVADEYLLYLPLYHSLKTLRIGIDATAWIAPAPARPRAVTKPIVFYGTSITQGGCASRTGMCHPALVGRWLDCEVINLGFSASGRMEPELADLLAELDPAIYVLDCLPNMGVPDVEKRLAPFVRRLRQAHPETPILLVEDPSLVRRDPVNEASRKVYEALKQEGVGGLHYLKAADVMPGRESPTVDGTHPTDLGFFRMAESFSAAIREILRIPE